jgi:sugar/nucleoside kinase (ribokinase family)
MPAGVECVFLGRSTLDLMYQVVGFPQENTKAMATEFLIQAGGPALNAAITFAFLGGSARLVSAVGRGAWADLVKAELERYGVRLTDLCDRESFSPPISSVVIPVGSGTRTVFNAPAHLPRDLPPLPDQGQFGGRLLLSDGFYVREAGTFVRDFAARGGVVSLDGGSWRQESDELLPLVSIAICSERFRPPGTDNDVDTLDYLSARGVPMAAITRGSADVIASDHGRRFSIPIQQVDAVDTLAAGDILHGAFCWYFLRGGNFEDALRAAVRAATRSVEFFGAREWMAHFAAESG